MNESPELAEGVGVIPFDTSSTVPLYLVHLSGGRKFQISRDLYAFLLLLNGRRSIADLAGALSEQWNRSVTDQEVRWIISEKLSPFGIVNRRDGAPALSGKSKRGVLKLWLKIPLVSERYLRPITWLGHFLFAKPAIITLLLLGGVVHGLTYLKVESLLHTVGISEIYSRNGWGILFWLLVSGVVHELGHLSACHRYGVRYGKLGVGLYMISPVGYVDVTDAWRLSRPRRVVVDLGGLYFQWLFNIVLFGLYLCSRQPILLFSILAITLSFVGNLNPMFKFDGYWAFSDAIGIPNLHGRAADIWRRILPRRGKRLSKAFLQTNKYIRITLGLYALAVAAYLGSFLWMMARFAPALVPAYPGFVLGVLAGTWESLVAGKVMNAGSILGQLVAPTFFLIGMCLMALALGPALYRAARGVYGSRE